MNRQNLGKIPEGGAIIGNRARDQLNIRDPQANYSIKNWPTIRNLHWRHRQEITRGQVAALTGREMKLERALVLDLPEDCNSVACTLSHAARAFLRVSRELQETGSAADLLIIAHYLTQPRVQSFRNGVYSHQ